MSNKHIDLFKEIIPLVDLGAKSAWSEASDEERKEIKGDMWNLNRYISSVKLDPRAVKEAIRSYEKLHGEKLTEAEMSREIQEHFVLTVNEYYNKHWNILQKNHANLAWMLLCMCSFDKKQQFFHEWIPAKRLAGDKKINLLLEWFPNMKEDEIELLSSVMTNKEFKEMAQARGMEDSEIKKIVK